MKASLNTLQLWTRIYFILMGLLYICALILLVTLLMFDPEYSEATKATGTFGLFMVLSVCFSLPFTILYFLNAVMIKKQSQFIFYLTMVNLIIGFGGFPTIIFSVILFIMWLQPEIKEYYLGSKQPSVS